MRWRCVHWPWFSCSNLLILVWIHWPLNSSYNLLILVIPLHAPLILFQDFSLFKNKNLGRKSQRTGILKSMSENHYLNFKGHHDKDCKENNLKLNASCFCSILHLCCGSFVGKPSIESSCGGLWGRGRGGVELGVR